MSEKPSPDMHVQRAVENADRRFGNPIGHYRLRLGKSVNKYGCSHPSCDAIFSHNSLLGYTQDRDSACQFFPSGRRAIERTALSWNSLVRAAVDSDRVISSSPRPSDDKWTRVCKPANRRQT